MKFVKIPDQKFEIAETPCTQAQWTEVMGSNPSHFKSGKDAKNRPVEMVSWNDVQEFIAKMNAKNDGYEYRLPTEQEWQICAGDEIPEAKLKDHAWYYANSEGSTQPVKKKVPNKFGLYDMLGNVWEWTASIYE